MTCKDRPNFAPSQRALHTSFFWRQPAAPDTACAQSPKLPRKGQSLRFVWAESYLEFLSRGDFFLPQKCNRFCQNTNRRKSQRRLIKKEPKFSGILQMSFGMTICRR